MIVAFIEPHTGRIVPLGTESVRQYCGEKPAFLTPARLEEASLYRTVGPINRFLDILREEARRQRARDEERREDDEAARKKEREAEM